MCFRFRKDTLRCQTIKVEVECPLCLDMISKRMMVCTECHTGMHKKCLDKWKLRCKLSERAFDCPMCRTEF